MVCCADVDCRRSRQMLHTAWPLGGRHDVARANDICPPDVVPQLRSLLNHPPEEIGSPRARGPSRDPILGPDCPAAPAPRRPTALEPIMGRCSVCCLARAYCPPRYRRAPCTSHPPQPATTIGWARCWPQRPCSCDQPSCGFCVLPLLLETNRDLWRGCLVPRKRSLRGSIRVRIATSVPPLRVAHALVLCDVRGYLAGFLRRQLGLRPGAKGF